MGSSSFQVGVVVGSSPPVYVTVSSSGIARNRSLLLCFVFFFQAEDGIRDFHVTGVQTCALPICFESEDEQEFFSRIQGDVAGASEIAENKFGSFVREADEADDEHLCGIEGLIDERSEERRVGNG